MEQIQTHVLQDIWRVRAGLLLVVTKHRTLGYVGRVGKQQPVRGCKGLRVQVEGTETVAAGTWILADFAVEPVTDVAAFRVEVKSSGGSIYGTVAELTAVLAAIQALLAVYAAA